MIHCFRHGISTHTGSMLPVFPPQGEDTGGNSGNLYVVCGGIFCRYAGIGDPQDHFPGSGEEGYPAQPAGKICPQRCNGEEAIELAGNITGRTASGQAVTTAWNPKAHYYTMNETLRASFYEGQWQPEHCEPYSIFVSQADYPLKGLHYLLQALPQIRRNIPGTGVCGRK